MLFFPPNPNNNNTAPMVYRVWIFSAYFHGFCVWLQGSGVYLHGFRVYVQAFVSICKEFVWICKDFVRICLVTYFHGLCVYLKRFCVRMSQASDVDLRAWDQSQRSRRGSEGLGPKSKQQTWIWGLGTKVKAADVDQAPQHHIKPVNLPSNPFWTVRYLMQALQNSRLSKLMRTPSGFRRFPYLWAG